MYRHNSCFRGDSDCHSLQQNHGRMTVRFLLDMRRGLNRVLYPIINIPYNKSCSEIYQPIISREIVNTDLCDDDYIKEYIDINSSLIGKVLLNKDNAIVDYDSVSSRQWMPAESHSRDSLKKIMLRETLRFQDWLVADFPNLDQITNADNKKHLKMVLRKIKQFNNLMLKKFKNEF